MKKSGKYDAIVLEALRNHEPVARAMRRAGFSEGEIRSCQGRLKAIRRKLAPEEDEDAWRARKHLAYVILRRAALERLESGESRNEHGDLQLIESYDRALKALGALGKGKACDSAKVPELNTEAVDISSLLNSPTMQ
jgi:hypothetical protein